MATNRNMILAIVNGIGNILTVVSAICVIIFLALGFINGFTGWRKEYLIFSIIGVLAFFLIAKLCKSIIRNSER